MLKGQPSRLPHPKYVQLWQYLHKKLSFMYEFQVVIFAFSLTLGDPFMVSPSLLKYGGVGLFSKNCFSWEIGGQIYGSIDLHGEINNQIIQREKEFQKMYFPVI